MVIHWGMDVFDFWPFNRSFWNSPSAGERDGAYRRVCLGGPFIMFVIYHNVVGRFGAIFFSGPMLLSGGGLGPIRPDCHRKRLLCPDHDEHLHYFLHHIVGYRLRVFSLAGHEKVTQSFSIWGLGQFLAVGAFGVLFFPHIGYQFYPAQIFMAAKPWWVDWALTQSSLFHFGWMVPALVLLYWTNMFWEGRPFSLIESPWLRGIVTAVSVIVAGIIIMFATNSIMDWYFGTEAFKGGSSVEQPAWRWNHVAEIVMFMAVAGSILYTTSQLAPKPETALARA